MKIMLTLHHCQIRSTDKSDTIKIFENLVETSSVKPVFTEEVLDGAAVVQRVVPKCSTISRSIAGTSLLHIYSTNVARVP